MTNWTIEQLLDLLRQRDPVLAAYYDECYARFQQNPGELAGLRQALIARLGPLHEREEGAHDAT